MQSTDTQYRSNLEFLEEQPNWGPRQVKTVEDLKVGLVYQEVATILQTARMFRVLATPHPKTIVPGFIFTVVSVEYLDNHEREDMTLEDVAVVPYRDGTWNPANYLLKVTPE